MTKTSITTFSKHEFRELTKDTTQSHPHTALFMTTIYSHAHHDDPQRNFCNYFLTVGLGVCSSSKRLSQ